MSDSGCEDHCTYAPITKCGKEGLDGKGLRPCYQCGSEGMHHHMCAVSTPELEQASSVKEASTSSTLCAVCAGVLTLEQVVTLTSERDVLATKHNVDSTIAMAATSRSIGARLASSDESPSTLQASASANASCNSTAAEQTQQGVATAEVARAEPFPTEPSAANEDVGVRDVANDSGINLTSGASCVGVEHSDGRSVEKEMEEGEHAMDKSDGVTATTEEAAGDWVDAPPDPTPSADTSPASVVPIVGTRVRELLRADETPPRCGLIYLEAGGQFSVAFDDLNWEVYPRDAFASEFAVIPSEQDTSPKAIRAVLIGRKGSLSLCSGFLLSTSAAASRATANSWEVFQRYSPAPVERSDSRYAKPPFDKPLQIGDAVCITPPFVSLAGCKAAADLTSPFTARIVCFLLGGAWNATKQHLDKRRWVAVECCGDFYFVPLDRDRISASDPAKLKASALTEQDCHTHVLNFLGKHLPSGVNNLYNTARNVLYIRKELRGSDGSQPAEDSGSGRQGLRPRVPPGPAFAQGEDNFVDLAGTQTPKPAGEGRGGKQRYNLFKDPDLVLPKDLKSFGPHKLNKLMLCVLLRALAAHGINAPPPGPKQKVQTIHALLRAVKKRPPPSSDSEGTGDGGTGGNGDSMGGDDASLYDGASSSSPTLGTAGRARSRRAPRNARQPAGRGGNGGVTPAPLWMDDDPGETNVFGGAELDLAGAMLNDTQGGLQNSRQQPPAGAADAAAANAAALRERELALDRKLERATLLEQELLAAKARMEAAESALLQQQRERNVQRISLEAQLEDSASCHPAVPAANHLAQQLQNVERDANLSRRHHHQDEHQHRHERAPNDYPQQRRELENHNLCGQSAAHGLPKRPRVLEHNYDRSECNWQQHYHQNDHDRNMYSSVDPSRRDGHRQSRMPSANAGASDYAYTAAGVQPFARQQQHGLATAAASHFATSHHTSQHFAISPPRGSKATYLAPTPPHVREGMEIAALRARAAARQRDEEERLAALQYKLSKYQQW